jgi:UDP-N-acetyl-D-galactosamine dehydrogenase
MHRAECAGYHPEVILAGRRINDGMGQRINDGMGQRIADRCKERLLRGDRTSATVTVTVLGLTFKENVPDTRNSKVVDIVRALASSGITMQVNDPLAHIEDAEHEYGIRLCPIDELKPADAVILAVAHDKYVKQGWSLVTRLLVGGKGAVLDVKAILDRAGRPEGVDLWRP